MLFSEKMSLIPQPRRANLWQEYRTLCTGLALHITLKKEQRLPTPEELVPLRQAARQANAILEEYEFSPSFFPDKEDFFPLLIEELTRISHTPSRKD